MNTINTLRIHDKQKLVVVSNPETFMPALNELIGYCNFNNEKALKYFLKAMIDSVECVDTEATETELIVKRQIDEDRTVDVLYGIEDR